MKWTHVELPALVLLIAVVCLVSWMSAVHKNEIDRFEFLARCMYKNPHKTLEQCKKDYEWRWMRERH